MGLILKQDLKILNEIRSKNDPREYLKHLWISPNVLLASDGHALFAIRYNDSVVDKGSKEFDRENLGEFVLVDLDQKENHYIEYRDGKYYDGQKPLDTFDIQKPNMNTYIRNLKLHIADTWIDINAEYHYKAMCLLHSKKTFCARAYAIEHNHAVVFQTNTYFAMLSAIYFDD